jgi:zinc transporter 7
MLGDVFLHLLPHALSHSHEHENHDHHHLSHHQHQHGHYEEVHAHTLSDLTLGLSILTGLLVFFVVEKYLRLLSSGTSGHGHSHLHGHGHLHDRGKRGVPKNEEVALSTVKKMSVRQRKSTSKSRTRKNESVNPVVVSSHLNGSSSNSSCYNLKPAALLNLCADALHNFTDGLAIAVACQASNSLAISTILAVAVHELPHEIGDFAILVKHGGFSKWGAFVAQWISALGAFLGCLVGLQYGKNAPIFVVGFTAGGFLYISCVNIMPDMLSSGNSLKDILLQVLMMGLGVAMMIYVALYCE